MSHVIKIVDPESEGDQTLLDDNSRLFLEKYSYFGYKFNVLVVQLEDELRNNNQVGLHIYLPSDIFIYKNVLGQEDSDKMFECKIPTGSYN